jgi:hypothetical protein
MQPRRLAALAALAVLNDHGASVAAAAPATCDSAMDCGYNGACIGGACVCGPGWTGDSCGTMDLLPVNASEGFNALAEGVSTWGGSAVYAEEDGLWHLFHSRILGGCGLDSWTTNSACYHATAASPAGPYGNDSLVYGAFCHNALVRRAADGTYLLWHIGDGAEPGGVKPCTATRADNGVGAALSAAGGAGGNIGFNTFSYAPSVWGPWTPMGVSVLNGSGHASDWDAVVTNLAPWPMPDGRVLLGFRGKSGQGVEQLGMAAAQHWRGPYTRLSTTPLFAGTPWNGSAYGEDAFLWVDATTGVGRLLFHRCCGPNPPGTPVAGYAYTASPGVFSPGAWRLSPDAPYSLSAEWANGTAAKLARRERPQLLLDAASGAPAVLFNGVSPSRGSDASFTMAARVAARGA